MITRTFNLFLIVTLSVTNVLASMPEHEQASLRCEQLSDSDANGVTLGSIPSAADWSKAFSKREMSVIEGLAKLRILTSQRTAGGSVALVDRALKHSYTDKYEEILKDLSSRHKGFSISALDSILKQEIIRLQDLVAGEDSEEAKEAKRRQVEKTELDQNKPVDPKLLELTHTKDVPGLSHKVSGGLNSRSRVMSDGRLLVGDNRWSYLFHPELNEVEFLASGSFVMPMPDGESVLILSEGSQTVQHRNRGLPFKSWSIDIYDVGTATLKKTPLSMSGFFDPEAGEDFQASDLSPSGGKLALLSSTVENRILIVDIATGTVTHEIRNEDQVKIPGSTLDVYFLDDENLIFIDERNLYKQNLLDGGKKVVALEDQSRVFKTTITSDRKHLVLSQESFKYTTYQTSDLTLVASKIPFRHPVDSYLMKSLPSNSGLYKATTTDSPIENSRQVGFYNLNHDEIFDFKGRYNDKGYRVKDIVVTSFNDVLYVFYELPVKGPMKMDIWRVPWK